MHAAPRHGGGCGGCGGCDDCDGDGDGDGDMFHRPLESSLGACAQD
jgi:hypothetical protein